MSTAPEKFMPYYDIRFFLHDIDLSITVQSVFIYSSINAVYESLKIVFTVDEQQITKEELYGQKDCKLVVTWVSEDAKQGDPVTWNLQIIDFKEKIDAQVQNQKQEDRHPFKTMVTIIAIPKDPMKFMTRPVNLVVPEDNSGIPLDILNRMVDKFIPDVKKDIKKSGKNETPIRQCLIPPLAFSAAVDGLDREYGLYNGPLFFQCRNEENTFSMWDLSKQIEEPPLYTVYVLSEGGEKGMDKEIYQKSGQDDTVFYTYSNIPTKYVGQQKALKDGYNHIYMKKPADKLFEVVKTNLEEVFNEATAKSGGKLYMTDDIKERFRFHTGAESNETFSKSHIAKKLMDSATIDFKMDRNLNFKNILRVGVPIDMMFESTRYSGHSGKYIVKAQVFSLIQQGVHHIANSQVYAFRANTLD